MLLKMRSMIFIVFKKSLYSKKTIYSKKNTFVLYSKYSLILLRTSKEMLIFASVNEGIKNPIKEYQL